MKLTIASGAVVRGRKCRRRQQGVVLYVALVVMIVMMLAGVAMLRSVGAGVGVAGNLSFKQNATLAGDRGTEAAITWILAQTSAILETDHPASGYYATWVPNFDPMAPYSAANPATVDWTVAPLATPAGGDDGAGNTVHYVIHRLCSLPTTGVSGTVLAGVPQQCAVQGSVANSGTGGIAAGQPAPPLFRVTSRVDGPRNTLSFVQVMVY